MNNNVKYRYEELLKLYPELYNVVPKSLIAACLLRTFGHVYMPINIMMKDFLCKSSQGHGQLLCNIKSTNSRDSLS